MQDEAAEIEQLRAECQSLTHAMQTGVKFDQETGSDDGSPKHLRVGVNSALVNCCALAQLLIDKGLITKLEYYRALRDGMRKEVDAYEQRLRAKLGGQVTLA